MPDLTEAVRKLVGADEQSVTPPQDGGDPASLKHLWAILIISAATIVFGIVIAFTGLFEIY